jgi:hypothetical protein
METCRGTASVLGDLGGRRTKLIGDGTKSAETAAQIVSRAMDAYERGDWELLRQLTHPEAEVEMLLLEGDAAHGPAELSDALRDARSGIHRPRASSIDDVAGDAAVMVGRIQHMAAKRRRLRPPGRLADGAA